MFIKKIIFFCSFLTILITGCNFLKKEQPESFYKDLILINVNDKPSFDDARITGSVHLTYEDIPDKVKNWNKEKELIIYCTNYACTESDRVGWALQEYNFKNIKIYKGGIQEWYQLHQKDPTLYPFEGKATQPFLKQPILKFEVGGKLPIINAEELSKRLRDARSS